MVKLGDWLLVAGSAAVGAVTFAWPGYAAAQAPVVGDPSDVPATVVFPYNPPPEGEAPVPPEVMEEPVRSPGNSYCYVGSHPVDKRTAPGGPWHETSGEHFHHYAPIDLRLFTRQGRCYYFVGDPVDFGYTGPSYGYYGAHPVAPAQGGHWCFMIGPHSHSWSPSAPQFRAVSDYYWWPGPYDNYFASYWPYYAYFYQDFYPRYYGGGAWQRGVDVEVAPPILHVPTPAPTRPSPGYGGRVPSAGNPTVGYPPGNGMPLPPALGPPLGGPPDRPAREPAHHGAAAFGPSPGLAPPAPGITRPPAPSLPRVPAAAPSDRSRGTPWMSGGVSSGGGSPSQAPRRGGFDGVGASSQRRR